MSDISKLNEHLFDQLDRLNKPLSDEQLKAEIDRTQAVTSVAKQIISAGTLVVEAEKVRQEFRSPLGGAKPLLEGIK